MWMYVGTATPFSRISKMLGEIGNATDIGSHCSGGVVADLKVPLIHCRIAVMPKLLSRLTTPPESPMEGPIERLRLKRHRTAHSQRAAMREATKLNQGAQLRGAPFNSPCSQ
jgi:hypothetical protein